eukprot:199762_1
MRFALQHSQSIYSDGMIGFTSIISCRCCFIRGYLFFVLQLILNFYNHAMIFFATITLPKLLNKLYVYGFVFDTPSMQYRLIYTFYDPLYIISHAFEIESFFFC